MPRRSRHCPPALWGPMITELVPRASLPHQCKSQAGKTRAVLAQIKHMQIRSISLKSSQTTFFVIRLVKPYVKGVDL